MKEKKMNGSAVPRIELEEQLRNRIADSLQCMMVNDILELADLDENDIYSRSAMEGHSLKVDDKLLGRLNALFVETKSKLHFTEDVDFFITGDSTVNAFSLAAEKPGKPHIVNVNSALIGLMTNDELRFVIGHELGHLINKDSSLHRLIHFVYPEGNHMPMVLTNQLRLWNQLAELMADRYGYMAVEKLDVCVSAFFKMASGLDLRQMDVPLDALLEDNRKHLEFFIKEGISVNSHPVNPIRVEALHLFASCKSVDELDKSMKPLIEILQRVGGSKKDAMLAQYIASAGLLAANVDEEISETELNVIIENLSATQMFPRSYLEMICQTNVQEAFIQSVKSLLAEEPTLRQSMFSYLIALVLADKQLTNAEILFIYDMGENVFGYCRKETAFMLAQMLQTDFEPALSAFS